MPKDARKPVEGNDGLIIASLFIPGHKPVEARINLKNIVNQATAQNRTPEAVHAAIINGIRRKYGDRIS